MTTHYIEISGNIDSEGGGGGRGTAPGGKAQLDSDVST